MIFFGVARRVDVGICWVMVGGVLAMICERSRKFFMFMGSGGDILFLVVYLFV